MAPEDVRLDPGSAGQIAMILANLADLIDPEIESPNALSDRQLWALSSPVVTKQMGDRRAASNRLRDHATEIYRQLGDSAPIL